LQLVAKGIAPDFDLIEELRLTPAKLVTVASEAPVAGLAPIPASEITSPGPTRFVSRNSEGLLAVTAAAPPAGFKSDSMALDLRLKPHHVVFANTKILWRIFPKPGSARPRPRPNVEFFDADKVGSPILLRHWRPGDRFQPIGMSADIKLQDLFTNQKVPRRRRHTVIVAATAKGEVFWVEGLRITEGFKLSSGTKNRLEWRVFSL
jgi:tRNA(Ile)-lysidine synthetase-like protein